MKEPWGESEKMGARLPGNGNNSVHLSFQRWLQARGDRGPGTC